MKGLQSLSTRWTWVAMCSFSGTNDSAASIKPVSNGSNTPTSSAFFYYSTFKRPRFRRSGRSENNTGSSEIRQNLNNRIKITYFISAWNVFSLAAILRFAVSVKSGTKFSPSSPGSSRFPMRGLWGRGWNLCSLRIFRKFSNFQPAQRLHNFSVTVLSFTTKI